jgi:hypothetical protein
MTLGSFSANSLKLIIILPFVLTRLETPEIAIWYLFAAVMALTNLADVGFRPTFSRLIAYAMAGADLKNLCAHKIVEGGQTESGPHWKTIETICSSMRHIYFKLTTILILIMILAGTVALIKPIAASPSPVEAWISWGIVLSSSAFFLSGNAYRAYLEGTNHVALIRRWDIYTAFGATMTSLAALLSGAGLVGLVVAQQGWLIVNVVRNRYLCGMIENGRYRKFKPGSLHPEVYQAAWPSAWRSGLGILMSQGLLHASGIMYAQLATSGKLASYLLGLRIIQAVSQASQAPFYSKLPVLARLHAAGKIREQVDTARRGMCFSYWVFVLAFILIGVGAQPFLSAIKSNADFPNALMWCLLGMAMFFERYGAMHIQLYSTTNHIIWHIANSIQGLIFIVSSILLFPLFDVYAFPIGILIGHLAFYDWYSASHSYKNAHLNFFNFEARTSLAPLIFLLTFCVYQWLNQ